MIEQLLIPILSAAALIAALLLARLTMTRLDDRRNITALVHHYGLSREDATALYRRARTVGFGAAYHELFGSRLNPPTDRRLTGVSLNPAKETPRD